jgi:Arc/MetJ family transcription regulator
VSIRFVLWHALRLAQGPPLPPPPPVPYQLKSDKNTPKIIIFMLHPRVITSIVLNMRLTVDIDDEVLSDLSAITGESKKSPAVALAVAEFVRYKKAREFGKLLREGSFDYPSTNDEIEKAQG